MCATALLMLLPHPGSLPPEGVGFSKKTRDRLFCIAGETESL